MRRTATAAMLTAACAFGHHSFQGSYLLDQQVHVHGKIALLLFRNPHSYLELDAPDGSGQTPRWSIEMGAMLPLSKRGLKPDSLRAGDEVTVTVTLSPPRNPAPGAHTGVLKTILRPSDAFEWGKKPGEVPKEWASD